MNQKRKTALHPCNSRLNWFIYNGDSTKVQECVKSGETGWFKKGEGKAMTRITADSVEELLNACIKVEEEVNRDLDIVETSMTIKYPFLGPPQQLKKDNHKLHLLLPADNANNIPLMESGASQAVKPEPLAEAKPETEPLLALARSDTHCHLMAHPVLQSFLMWKWGRIAPYFYLNIAMFMMFIGSLHFYIFTENFTKTSCFNSTLDIEDDSNITEVSGFTPTLDVEEEFHPSDIANTNLTLDVVEDLNTTELPITRNLFTIDQIGGNSTWKWTTFFFLLILTLKEFAQLLWALTKCEAFKNSCISHFTNLENWLEFSLIVSTFLLLFPPNGVDIKSVTAMSILLAWLELVFLVGNHPWVSIYRTMFTHVSWNFFKFLLWLFWLIFSTGLAFSFLLHYEMEVEGEQKNENFQTVKDSVFKTIVMSFTGEIEFGNIIFSTDYKKFFFVLYIFFVFLVLVNLLNGLAISDISVIQKESKVNSLVSRLEAIYKYEKFLLHPVISWILRTFYISYALRTLSFYKSYALSSLLHMRTPSFPPKSSPSSQKNTYLLWSEGTNIENETAKFGFDSANWISQIGYDIDDVEEAILREAKAIYDQTAENAEQKKRMKTMEKQMKETVDKLEKLEKLDTKLDKLEELDSKLKELDTKLDKLEKLDTKLEKLDKLDEILQAIMAPPSVRAEEATGTTG